ncbi:LytR C-terminal domain-containing protein [Nocardioides taihuensis]|uniref:LytR C-terminal domain-containing protein n=1 Tax=Nocardioides taihuensis TaxID=1835606 RepID=A0ABW0BK12_9ACTN
MTSIARSALTLAGLTLLLVLATWWAWSAVTEPLPGGGGSTAACTDSPISEGEKVYPGAVTVSVLNASERNGLATETLSQFRDAGFDTASAANAPDKADVRYAEIWTPEPKNPAVLLVESRLGKQAKVVRKGDPGTGVVVVVGDGFTSLTDGKDFVTASYDTEICSPSG